MQGIGASDIGNRLSLRRNLFLIEIPHLVSGFGLEGVHEQRSTATDGSGILDQVGALRIVGFLLGGELARLFSRLPREGQNPATLAELAMFFLRHFLNVHDWELGQVSMSNALHHLIGGTGKALEALDEVVDCASGRVLHFLSPIETELPAHAVKILRN